MNPLIKELASKALKQPDTDNDGLTVFDNDELTKFAELIVKECEQRLRKEGELAKIQAFTGSEYKFAYMNQAANIVKQHFGVEL